MTSFFATILLLLTSILFVYGMTTLIGSSNSVSPDYGYVISEHHDNSGYYVGYSDQGSLWYAKISYASYVTCKPGMYWQGQPTEICTNTK